MYFLYLIVKLLLNYIFFRFLIYCMSFCLIYLNVILGLYLSKICFSVLEKIYELLGILGEVHPSEMVNNSEKLFRAFLGELKTQVR